MRPVCIRSRRTCSIATLVAALLATGTATLAAADMQRKHLTYEFEGSSYALTVIWDAAVEGTRSGVLMVPNWMGPSDNAYSKAEQVAGSDHVVAVVDMYGVDVRPQNSEEAGAAAGAVRGDRALMRRRANEALRQFVANAAAAPLDTGHIAAIGFCFGGGTVLELARSGTGAPLQGVVSFHGNLDTPDPADAKRIACPVLVLHGADDPFVPQEQVQGFVTEMRAAEVDFQLVQYGGAVHSFTNPAADRAGQAAYHERTAKRSFAAMRQFFSEILP